MNEKIEIFTDGGCHGNPGPGAWAFCAINESREIISSLSGYDRRTTNNRMELRAVIEALNSVAFTNSGAQVTVVTDSTYVQKGVTEWMNTWKRNGWQTAARKPVKNRELWQELDTINGAVRPRWAWVRGHSGNEFNELCDTLVQEEIKKNAR